MLQMSLSLKILALMIACFMFVVPASVHGAAEQRGARGEGSTGQRDPSTLTDRDKQERLDHLGKALYWWMSLPEPGPDNVFLHARAADLLARTKQLRTNNFQFDRLARAVDALLRASDRIFSARKATQTDENDRRDAAEFLQRCYFRAQQADYFADLSGEKETKKYVTLTRSLYQQARGAYDSRQYDRARMLGEASSLLVMALENIAHASLNIPDPPVIK